MWFKAASCCPIVCVPQVSADGEVKLYEACVAAGITLLSIAHRCVAGVLGHAVGCDRPRQGMSVTTKLGG